jgi:hypothetical protein
MAVYVTNGGVPLSRGGVPIAGSSGGSPSTSLQADLAPWYGSYLIGGTQTDYANAGFQTWASRNVVNILANYPTMETDMGVTFATITNNIWAEGQALGVNARCFPYFAQDHSVESTGGATFNGYINWLNTENGWTRTTYPSGSIVQTFSGFGDRNGCEGGPVDGNGRNTNEFLAYYTYQVWVVGDGGTLFGDPANYAPCNTWCGPYWDNGFWAPRTAGSWTWGSDITNLPSVAPAIQQGNADLIAAQKALWTTSNVPSGQAPITAMNIDIGAAVANGGATTSDIYTWAGLIDVPLFEEAIGPSTVEASNGFQALINGIIAQKLTLTSSGRVYLQTFGGHNGYGWSDESSQSDWVAADWTALRYSECIAFIMDCILGIAPSTGYPAQTNFQSDTQNNGGLLGYTWLGKALAPSPASYAAGPTSGWGGLWTRPFQNGIAILNPTSSPITVTVGASGMIASGAYSTMNYNGFSDSTVNTNTVITSNFTIPAFDGRILVTA